MGRHPRRLHLHLKRPSIGHRGCRPLWRQRRGGRTGVFVRLCAALSYVKGQPEAAMCVPPKNTNQHTHQQRWPFSTASPPLPNPNPNPTPPTHPHTRTITPGNGHETQPNPAKSHNHRIALAPPPPLLEPHRLPAPVRRSNHPPALFPRAAAGGGSESQDQGDWVRASVCMCM